MTDHADEVERDDGPGQGERVAKALARAGVASRREVERYIAEGRVALNGAVLTTPAVKVGPGDILTVDGAVVGEPEGTRVWRYHKPVGLMTTHNDPGGRPTVFEALPKNLPRVISIGRLDLNSEGLLLLTNDGAVARALELPSNGWVRRYRARAYGAVTQEKLDGLKGGITVEGVRYGPIEAKLDKVKEGASGANNWITVSITEGKNREVRRVLEALGLRVNRLIRLAYGPFQLGTLAVGEVAEVGPRVLREQLAPLVPGLRVAEGRQSPSPLMGEDGPKGRMRVPDAKRSGSSSPRRPAPDNAYSSDPAPRGHLLPSREKEGEEPKVYKPGWAKPKKRAGPPRPPSKAKPDRVEARSLPSGPSAAPTRPGAPRSRDKPPTERPAAEAKPPRSEPRSSPTRGAPPARPRPPSAGRTPGAPRGGPRGGGGRGRSV